MDSDRSPDRGHRGPFAFGAGNHANSRTWWARRVHARVSWNWAQHQSRPRPRRANRLLVNGILYFTIPDHIFAINARTGEPIWQYDFQDKGGHLVGQRGVGMYRNWLYFESPDGWFISLNAKDGKERW